MAARARVDPLNRTVNSRALSLSLSLRIVSVIHERVERECRDALAGERCIEKEREEEGCDMRARV